MRLLLLLLFAPLCAHEGIAYTYLENQWAHVIDVDPEVCAIVPAKAIDNGIGRESVLSLAERSAAIAGINGGFFAIGGTLDGRACGALKIDDWIALPTKPRGCIGWSPGSTPLFGRLLVAVNSSMGPIDGLNRARNVGEAILFSPLFNRTTLTTPDGEELVARDGRVTEIHRSGSTRIPDDGYVLSIQQENPLYGTLEVGAPLTFTIDTLDADWDSCEYIVGGTPLLIQQGKPIRDFSVERTLESFLTERHSRTAIGRKANGHWLFVVADQTWYGGGLTMDELVDLMISLGCVDALNLDGGGSSTMVYNTEVVNTPHGDEDEGAGQQVVRRVSDAILICPADRHADEPALARAG